MSGFPAGGIRAISSEWEDQKAGVLRAVAVLSLALPTPPEVETARLVRFGFKIGLLIRDGQRIVTLLASAEPSEEDERVTRDLANVFGTPAGSLWVGHVFKKPPIPSYPVADVAEYALELVLTGVTELPQMIPAPSRYGNEGSFGQSHLTALWVVQRPRGDSR
jgi:hypothetical protein